MERKKGKDLKGWIIPYLDNKKEREGFERRVLEEKYGQILLKYNIF